MITSTTSRKDYINRLKSLLDNLDKKVSTWESDLQDAKEDAQSGSRSLVRSVRNKRDLAKQQLVKVQNAGEHACDDIAEGAESAIRDLEEAFSEARSRFAK